MGAQTEPAWLQRGRFWRTSELNDRGLDDKAVRRLAEAGILLRLSRGCWVSAAGWSRMSREQQTLQRAYAHQHAVAPLTNGLQVYSHTTAAAAHGLSLVQDDPLVHVSQAFNPGPKSATPGVRRHRLDFDARDVVVIDGLTCTSLERTVVDCARLLQLGPAVAVADQALRRGANRSAMVAILGKCRGFKGIATARAAVGFADPSAESVAESLTRVALDRLNIRPPVPQFEVQTRLGTRRLDFAWPELKLALEFDGDMKYYGAVPTREVLVEERKRERLLQEEGWLFIRIGWKDLFNDGALKARIRRQMDEAARRLGPTPSSTAKS